jgi:DNA (cytosine-5)-methyltransferase 1
MLRVLDLFSGIGGFSLGLERTGGFKTVAFCEIEPYPRKVLAKHWPEVPCYHDVRELTAERLAADGIGVDVICGGFPCQDISVAGAGAGLAGERSGLWSEFSRLIGELRPRYAIVENVSALLSRGLADVLGDLAALRYDAEWHCIPASAVGAPHRRDRVWIIAHPISCELRHESGRRNGARWVGETIVADDGEQGNVADADNQRQLRSQRSECDERGWAGNGSESLANANGQGLQKSEAFGGRLGIALGQFAGFTVERSGWWLTEPNVGRVANGVPSRMDRLKGLGNAVVPQIPELIGRAILAAGA